MEETINHLEVLTAETIQRWKLFKGGNYMRKYGTHSLSNLFQPYKGERPPTPRQLKDVLTSSARANEFHAYLADMDKTHEEYTKQTYLNFALKCNELRKAANSKEAAVTPIKGKDIARLAPRYSDTSSKLVHSTSL